MKKVEKNELFDELSMKLHSDETKKAKIFFVLIIIAAVMVGLVVFLDDVISSAMFVYGANADIVYHQEGFHKIKFTVHGNGTMALRLHRHLSAFNAIHILNSTTTNEDCAAHPSETSRSANVLLIVCFFFIILLTLTEAYFLRLRRKICAAFYQKREKIRTLKLYNDTLVKRKKYLHYKIDRAKKLAEEGTLLDSEDNTESRCCGLRKKVVASCAICSDKSMLFECQNCHLKYCEQCFQSIKQVCLNCTTSHGPEHRMFSDDQVTQFIV